MYLDYWGLKELPFENIPSEKLYRSPQHEEALVRLLFASQNRKGVAMLTGSVGTGKTTVAKTFIQQLTPDKYDFQIIFNPALSPIDMIRAILLNYGEDANSDSKTVLLNQLHKRLYQNADKGLTSILVIDEAHVIDDQSTLDELRMLLNLHGGGRFLVTLILLGQPPLLEKIDNSQPLKERIGVKYHLEPLDLQNTMRYILFRMKNAGASRGTFSKEAIIALHKFTGGIPLRINNVCDRCLLIGLMRRAMMIDAKTVNEAIEDTK